MADKKNQRGTDESVDLKPIELRINPDAEQNPPQRDMDERHSRRLSADLPFGIPTDDTHLTGTPQRDISSGFSDLRAGDMPHLETDNAQHVGGVQQSATRLGGSNMAEEKDRNNPQTDDSYDRPTGENSRYDAEKEIPDPEQVDRDIEEAERRYRDKGDKVA